MEIETIFKIFFHYIDDLVVQNEYKWPKVQNIIFSVKRMHGKQASGNKLTASWVCVQIFWAWPDYLKNKDIPDSIYICVHLKTEE